jgi:hypothetical protein
MNRLVLVIVLTLAANAMAQDLAGALHGVYGETLGAKISVDIPNYGHHAVVQLLIVDLTPAESRDMALPLFVALATARGGVVSASVHVTGGFGADDYVLVFQYLDGAVSVYLDGEPFDP